MYAIVETGGKQYRVRPGDTIAVERLQGEPGDTLELERVLFIGGDGAETRLGTPAVDGAIVRAEVVEHGRGEKIIVFRYKSKVRYRRRTGHRQALTRLRITDILPDRAQAPTTAEDEAPAARRRRAPVTTEPEAVPAVAAQADVPTAAAAESAESTEETRTDGT